MTTDTDTDPTRLPRGCNIAVHVTDHDAGTTRTHTTHNVTCREWHALLVRYADPEDSLTAQDVEYRLHVGSDSDEGVGYRDTSLNNKLFEGVITDYQNLGTELYTTAFIDSTEGNPGGSEPYQSLREIGIAAHVERDGAREYYFLNHSTIPEVQKNDQVTVTVEATLELLEYNPSGAST